MWNDGPELGRKPARRAGLVCAAIALMAGGSAQSATPGFEPGREIVLVCTVAGAANIHPSATSAQICAVFKRRFDAALGRATRLSPALQGADNAVQIAVRMADARSASAAVTTIARGKSTRWPELTVDVMDRHMGMREIEQLAGEVARAIGLSR
jgi:hypothetical protein